MHTNDQHFFIIGSIEDAYSSTFRQSLRATPEKIVIQLFSTGLLETENLAALRIDTGHHMLDGTVFAGGVHGLENQQYRKTVGTRHETEFYVR